MWGWSQEPRDGCAHSRGVSYANGNAPWAVARVREGSGSEAAQAWRPWLSGAFKHLESRCDRPH